MSPSENDLRRALHSGENEGGIDVARIVVAGERHRSQRRARIRSGGAVGALVAVVATGGVLLARSGGTDDEAGGSAGGGSAKTDAPLNGAAAPEASSAARRPGGSSTGPACPTAFPRLALPGGGGTGQFGAGAKLFAKPVRSITVCGYGVASGTGRLTGQLEVSRLLVSALASSLENASKTLPTCGTRKGPAVVHQFALLPTATDGSTLRTVTVELDGCPDQVTNGTAIRAAWQPPAGLRGVFARLGAPTTTTPGRVQGSPVRS